MHFWCFITKSLLWESSGRLNNKGLKSFPCPPCAFWANQIFCEETYEHVCTFIFI